MTRLRHFLLAHRPIAAIVLAAALLLRLLVPAGFMPIAGGDGVRLALCSGQGPMAMGHRRPARPAHEAPGGTCAFADLTMPGLAGADPVAIPPAPVVTPAAVAPAFAAILPRLTAARPPSRGPPPA